MCARALQPATGGQLATANDAPTTWVSAHQSGGILEASILGAFAQIKETLEDVIIQYAVVDTGEIKFTALEIIGGNFAINRLTNLKVLSCPKLHTAKSTATFNGNLGLSKLHLPELASTKGSLQIQYNYDLVSASVAHSTMLPRTMLPAFSCEPLPLRIVAGLPMQKMFHWHAVTSTRASLARHSRCQPYRTGWSDAMCFLAACCFGCLPSWSHHGHQRNISMPKLAEVDGNFQIHENPALETIAFPFVKKIDGTISINRNQNLTRLDFAELIAAGGTHVTNNANLQSVTFPKLTQLTGGGLYIYRNPRLISISFPSVRSLNNVGIYGNTLLATLHFDALATFNPLAPGPLIMYLNGDGLDCTKLKDACRKSTDCASRSENSKKYASGFAPDGKAITNKDTGKYHYGPELTTC